MAHESPVVIQVSRQEVDQMNTQRIVAILDNFLPTLAERNRNRVHIEVLGYSQDRRELFDVPEVRTFFQMLFDQVSGMFFWIDVTSYMLIFMGLMLYPPYRTEGQVGLRPADMQAYLLRGFEGLNEFCETHNLSPDETNRLINRAIKGT